MAKHKNSNLAAATYLVCVAPLFTNEKDEPFIKYHMHQAVGLLVFAFALQGVISWLGFWGFPLKVSVWPVRAILLWELYVGMKGALNGETKPLPWIGGYAAKLSS